MHSERVIESNEKSAIICSRSLRVDSSQGAGRFGSRLTSAAMLAIVRQSTTGSAEEEIGHPCFFADRTTILFQKV